MTEKNFIFFLTKTILVLVVLSAGCVPNPKTEAEARAIDADTVAVQSETRLNEMERYGDIEDREEVKEETQEDRVAREKIIIRASTWFSVIALAAFAVSVSISSIDGSIVFVRYVDLRARLIWLNKVTRTFPIMIGEKTDSGWRFVDFESGERSGTGVPNLPDYKRLAATTLTRLVGLLGQSAEKIAQSTRDARAADSLPEIAQGVPVVTDWMPQLVESSQAESIKQP